MSVLPTNECGQQIGPANSDSATKVAAGSEGPLGQTENQTSVASQQIEAARASTSLGQPVSVHMADYHDRQVTASR